MSVEQMRDYLLSLYPYSERWQERVKRMPEAQVIAVYFSKTRG